MITDDDVKKLSKTFATKSDLKGFATKDDLKKFATKDDLKGFATKDDLKGLATKEVVTNIADRLVKVEMDLAEVKENMMTKDDHRDIMTAFDEMFGHFNNLELEQGGQSVRIDDAEDTLKKHAKRLDKIESIPVIAQQIKGK